MDEFPLSENALTDNLEIKDSSIHGQGLFAKADIPADTNLGESHVFLMQNYDLESKSWERKEWIRRTMGAFLNHSDEPNATCSVGEGDNKTFLITTQDVKAGDEITVTYDADIFKQMGL